MATTEGQMALGEKEWHEHAALIGRVTLAWNQNVHQLLRVLIHLTGIESPVADAIFFSPQSDSAQRKLIKRVAEAVELGEQYRASLEKILKRLEEVSSGRNLATHVIFGISAFDPETNHWGATVVPTLNPPQDSRLQPDFTAQFQAVEQKLHALHRDLENRLIHTPFPPRSFDGPPLPKAAAAAIQARIAELDAGSGDEGQPMSM
ncbi:hypothetical protein [Novosphingobium sp. SG707]|uniref:hypothetical protein n=1 Tax=Novosphingobium sp. SG707 TaxID=2586996 RepID=UPI001444DCDF|nr:hypothetical protein [Novosphingobium sp. SG707]NKJ02967.1 hypothetical protein [Novosphingobium sp. SG707]